MLAYVSCLYPAIRALHLDSLDVELGPVPVEVEGVPGLFGLEMDPEANSPTCFQKSVKPSTTWAATWRTRRLGMLDPSAKEEFEDVKSDIKTADMILPGWTRRSPLTNYSSTWKTQRGRGGV